MKKIAPIVGVLLMIGLLPSFYIYNQLGTPLKRCTTYYLSLIEQMEEDDKSRLRQAAKKEGFYSLQELVQNRCQYWISNGQSF